MCGRCLCGPHGEMRPTHFSPDDFIPPLFPPSSSDSQRCNEKCILSYLLLDYECRVFDVSHTPKPRQSLVCGVRLSLIRKPAEGLFSYPLSHSRCRTRPREAASARSTNPILVSFLGCQSFETLGSRMDVTPWSSVVLNLSAHHWATNIDERWRSEFYSKEIDRL